MTIDLENIKSLFSLDKYAVFAVLRITPAKLAALFHEGAFCDFLAGYGLLILILPCVDRELTVFIGKHAGSFIISSVDLPYCRFPS